MVLLKQLGNYLLLRLGFISEISKDIAQVLFATFVIGSFTKGTVDWNQFILGLVSSFIWWVIGIISYRKK